MTLLLTIFETLALVVLKHAMLTAVVALAEAAVANNGLGTVLAVIEGAADFLGGHAAAQGECEVQCCVWADGVVRECGRGVGEVLAGVDYAQV
jgi:hypothetical protein